MNSERKKPKHPAWDTALKLLTGRDFSASEMTERLAGRGYEQDEIERTVNKLKEYGYVIETGNDRMKLCEMAREYLLKKNKTELTPGTLRSLEAYLLRKGFDAGLVGEYLQLLADAGEGSQ
jgi:SOS response regulatory protein OraA/RecX